MLYPTETILHKEFMRVTYTLCHITSSEYEGKKECIMVTCNQKITDLF